MIICVHCHTDNPPGSASCIQCGAALPDAPPIRLPAPSPPPVDLNAATEPAGLPRRTDTQPLHLKPGFIERPSGAIFGGRFLYDSLHSKDTNLIRYTVTEIQQNGSRYYQVCTNPNCGVILVQEGPEIERYCSQCGSPLQGGSPLFWLLESPAPFPGCAGELTSRSLAHPNVSVPLVYFHETLAGSERYCLVSPYYTPLPNESEPIRLLQWGIALANGLDYLHKNGIVYGGQINSECFGMPGSQVAWVSFTGCNIPTDMLAQARSSDVRALAQELFRWVTGKTQYTFDSSLSASVNSTFQRAFSAPGFASAGELAMQISQALSEPLAQPNLDYHIGRMTDLGKERSLNEDSLLTLEMSRVTQSINRPLGVFAIADGMGGHSAGEIASATIIDILAQQASSGLVTSQPDQPLDFLAWVKSAVEAANQRVYELRRQAGTDMGSTLVLALLNGAQAYLAHAGDSRAYLVNTQGIQQLTTDHTLVERLIATGQISREAARRHPQRHVVYRTVGDRPAIEVDSSSMTLTPGDRLLLCSDGLNGMLQDQQIFKLVMESNSPQAACERLVEAANQAGGEDNISVILIQLIKK